jgi:pimeloyl-ACP methyl ester carboxylesterase
MASHRFIGWCATLLLTLCASAQAAQLTGDPQPDPQYPPAMAELTILSNGSRMPALLYQANGAGPHPTVLLLHGFPGNEKNLDIAQVLRRDGFNVLFFHYRGAWGTEGTTQSTNWMTMYWPHWHSCETPQTLQRCVLIATDYRCWASAGSGQSGREANLCRGDLPLFHCSSALLYGWAASLRKRVVVNPLSFKIPLVWIGYYRFQLRYLQTS